MLNDLHMMMDTSTLYIAHDRWISCLTGSNPVRVHVAELN